MPKTYNDLYIELRNRLKAAGVEACALEARLLVARAADKTPTKLLEDLRLYTSPEVEQRVKALAARRMAGEPVAYLTESWEFYGLDLAVNASVLIPRPDTEVLVDKALELCADHGAERRILDLCTGSGCIACALGKAMPHSRLVMGDISREALSVARENVRRCGLGARTLCVEADALLPPPPQMGGFDLMVSNPPYIATDEVDTLDASVRKYEPRLALDGGADGLKFYRAILQHWTPLLRQGGWLLFEVGETQAKAVMRLMQLVGMQNIGTAKDTGGYDRVVFGQK